MRERNWDVLSYNKALPARAGDGTLCHLVFIEYRGERKSGQLSYSIDMLHNYLIFKPDYLPPHPKKVGYRQ